MKKFETKRKANKSYSLKNKPRIKLLPAVDIKAYINDMVKELGEKFKNIK